MSSIGDLERPTFRGNDYFLERIHWSMDIRSIGCILGEIMHKKPLFPRKDYAHQLKLITEVFGKALVLDEIKITFIRFSVRLSSTRAAAVRRTLPSLHRSLVLSCWSSTVTPPSIHACRRLLCHCRRRIVQVVQTATFLGRFYNFPAALALDNGYLISNGLEYF